MKFRIDRAKWVCGTFDILDVVPELCVDEGLRLFGRSALLNGQGRMCCLGQICEQAGIPPSHLEDIGAPHENGFRDRLQDTAPELHELLVTEIPKDVRCEGMAVVPMNATHTGTPLAMDMMKINDRGFITQEEREDLLIKKAAKQGIELEFYGELGLEMDGPMAYQCTNPDGYKEGVDPERLKEYKEQYPEWYEERARYIKTAYEKGVQTLKEELHNEV
jgi:hypothetical protein